MDEGRQREEEGGHSGEDEEPEHVQRGRGRDVQSLQSPSSHIQGKKKYLQTIPQDISQSYFHTVGITMFWLTLGTAKQCAVTFI